MRQSLSLSLGLIVVATLAVAPAGAGVKSHDRCAAECCQADDGCCQQSCTCPPRACHGQVAAAVLERDCGVDLSPGLDDMPAGLDGTNFPARSDEPDPPVPRARLHSAQAPHGGGNS